MEYEDVPKPVKKNNEILVKVKASSLNMADNIVMGGKPFAVRLMGNGVLKLPKITYWQGVGLLILTKILFGGIGSSGRYHKPRGSL